LLVVVVVVLAYTPWGRPLAPVESAAGPAAIGGPFTLIDQDGKPHRCRFPWPLPAGLRLH
jgi:hypothetical protein